MSAIIGILTKSPLDAQQFKELSASNLTSSLADRRAVGIKREIETLLENPSSTLNEKVVIADRTISAFVQELTERSPSFQTQAEKLKTELTTFVQKKSKELFQREKDVEAKKAKDAFENFGKAIKASAEQKKQAYTEKLDRQDADVLSEVDKAKQDISTIEGYQIPDQNQEAAALRNRIIQELTHDLSVKAITAQSRKVERAFGAFLENNKPRIDNAKKSLEKIQQGWSQEVAGKNPTVFIMELSKDQKPLDFQDAAAYDRPRLEIEKELLAKEVNALHQLKNLPEFSGNFSSSAALSNNAKALQSDQLFQKAEEARSLARTLETTKSAAVAYDLKKGEINDSFAKTDELISSLEKALLEKEGPVSEHQITSLKEEIVQNNENSRKLLDDLEKLREAMIKGIPGIQLNHETKFLLELLGSQESSYERFNEFRNAKTVFQNGNFEDLNQSSFSYLKPDAPRDNPMFAMLNKIASEKMAVGDVRAARLYKTNLEAMLNRIDNQKLKDKFTIPELKKTWGEKVQEFFSSLFSSISNSFSSIKAWFMSFFSKEEVPAVDHLSRRPSNASTLAAESDSISENNLEYEEESEATSSPRASQYYENRVNNN